MLRKAGIGRHKLENLLYDDEVGQAIERRQEVLKAAKFTLTPSDGEAAKFVFEQLETHLESILIAALDSKWYGYDVAEMVWDDGLGRNVVSKITSKPMEWFDIDNKNQVKWFPYTGGLPVILSAQDDFDFRFMVQRHNPSYKHPKGQAILSRVYWLWYFKTNGWRFWSKYLEKFGSPTLVGKGGDGTQEDADNFAAALLAAHSSGVVVVGKDEDVVALNPGNNGEAFINYDKAVAKRITTYLLGQTLTSGTENGGTYGQGKIHQQQQELIFNSDRTHALKAVQRFINIICIANGYEPPVFAWIDEKGLQPERATRDKDLYAVGWRPTRAYFADYYDMENHHFYMVDEAPIMPAGSAAYASNWRASAPVKQKFTPEQQALEDMSDMMLKSKAQPIEHSLVWNAVVNAKDEEDMKTRLFAICGKDMDKSEFMKMFASALMVADIRGYADNAAGL